MRHLLVILILILGSCSIEPESKSINPNCGYEIDGYYAPEYDDYFQFEWIGDWEQMTSEVHGKTGRWPKNKDFTDTVRYRFYGHGINVMTEINPNHSGYQVIIDGTLRAEVVTSTDSEIGTDVKTWSTECLTVGNHVLELVRLNDQGSFVINGLQINFYVNPDLQGWNPCYDECLPCKPALPEPSVTYFLDDFEDGILHVDPWWHPLGDGTETIVTDPTDANNKVLRMWIERKKYPSNGPARAQIEYNPAPNPEIPRYFPWFTTHGTSFRMYVPDDWIPDVHGELFWQEHQWASTPNFRISIPLSLSVEEGGNIRTKIITAPVQCNSNSAIYKYFHNEFTIRAGHWYYFVINTHWDYRTNGNGFHDIYISEDVPCTENDLVRHYAGGTGYNDTCDNDLTCYQTWSIYKYDWQYQDRVDDSEAAGVDYREYFFDDLYIQEGGITFGKLPIDPPCTPDTIYIEIPLDTVFVYDTLYLPGPPVYLQPNIYIVADSIIYEIK